MTAYGASTRQPLELNGKTVEHGSTRRLKDGTLVYEFTPPHVPGRKRQGPKVMKGITTATDAKREIERLLPAHRDDSIGDHTIKLGALYPLCLAAMRSGEFKHMKGLYTPRSIELFEQKCDPQSDAMRGKGVLDRLGRSMPVADIKPAHLRRMMTALTNEGLSGSTVQGYLSQASAMLRYAVQQEMIDSNPANAIGRGERPAKKRLTEPRYLTVAEVERLLEKVTDETSKAVIGSMFWGALRVSEALELRWSDVLGSTLLVRGTKTKGSWAEIPLLPQLAKILNDHRERLLQLVREGKLGMEVLQPDALIFQTGNGTALGRRNILRSIYAAGDAAKLNEGEGVEKVGAHDMRHSMAGVALDLPGMNMVKVAKLLRHANPQVTAIMYAGLSDESVEELGEELAEGLGG